ncbi:oligosaccharide flippase family protein [Vulcanisaeta distributa]|uniref:Polysaccharide biosynthesis protein n=1 Tax=Vulcanisaeta distributa (strain DSM 14429 / JCM 11212 / NBRC 100878 / IC-017) TaxID=572478 RepID=E1QUD6_VULDI|nr:oligosaccharide flippase family protein [Vulcanisaeta distributa]ADN49862.1 polysaccharide biosynthesis protein [Vulcanisaeta distributa DSM 14429]
MSRAGVKAVRGSLWITSGRFIYNAVGFIGSIVIARLLTPGEYGLISIALTYPLFFTSIADLGLSTAIMRYAAAGMHRHALSAVLLRSLSGIAFGLALVPLSTYLALTLRRPYLSLAIQILSIYTIAYMVQTSVNNYLIGVGRYGDFVILDLVRNITRISVSIALILIGLGVYGAYWGFSIGYLAAAFLAIFMLPKVEGKLNIKGVVNELFNYSIPLYIPTLISIPLGQLYNILIAIYVTNTEMGNYQIANNLLAVASLVSGSVSTALFSALPEFIGEDYKLRSAINRAAYLMALIISPIALALALFSRQAVYVVYGSSYSLAPLYLSIMAINLLLSPLGVITMYLNIIGDTRLSMVISLINTVIGLPITWALLVRWSMLGAVIASIINGAIGTAITYGIVKARHNLTVNIPKTIYYMLPGILSYIATYLILTRIKGLYIQLLIGLPLYVILMGILIALITDVEDLKYLSNAVRNIKYVGPLISRLVSIEIDLKAIL